MTNRPLPIHSAAFALLLLLPGSFAAAPAGAAPAEVASAAGQADALCRRYADAVPPAADRPTAAQAASLADCDGEALLYGIGRPADPVRARLCAFGQVGDRQQAGLFAGDGLLMTIYANGFGVPRNRAVAVHLACDGIWSAPAERESRVPHLAGMSHQPSDKAVFSPCDDITSGQAAGECAAHDARMAEAARARSLDLYAAALPPPARPAFAALRRAQAAWAEARADNEIDLSGSARAAFAIAEQSLQTDDFVSMVQRLRTGRPPRLGAAELRRAQNRIGQLLPPLLARPAPDVPGEVTADGIRKAQSAWTAYRDAWGNFAAIAYPGWGPDGAEAWVSMKRADMLGRMD